MKREDSLSRAISEDIRLVPHDPHWTAQFTREQSRLMSLFPGRFIAIEHVGSTAVPNLSAKPIIDILAGVRSLEEADALLTPLCEHGYATSAEFNATLTDSRWLMLHDGGKRTHHLHLVVFNGEPWRRYLLFRDALRSDSATALRYELLKQKLSERYRHDREAYTHEKAAFIHGVIAGKNLSYD